MNDFTAARVDVGVGVIAVESDAEVPRGLLAGLNRGAGVAEAVAVGVLVIGGQGIEDGGVAVIAVEIVGDVPRGCRTCHDREVGVAESVGIGIAVKRLGGSAYRGAGVVAVEIVGDMAYRRGTGKRGESGITEAILVRVAVEPLTGRTDIRIVVVAVEVVGEAVGVGVNAVRGCRIAVVIDAVIYGFQGSGIDRGAGVVAVGTVCRMPGGCGAGLEHRGRTAVSVTVAIGVEGRGDPLVGLAVAVVIPAVAEFASSRVYSRVGVVTIPVIGEVPLRR